MLSMFRKKEKGKSVSDRPEIKVYGYGALRVDSAILIKTPEVQEQLEVLGRLESLNDLYDLENKKK